MRNALWVLMVGLMLSLSPAAQAESRFWIAGDGLWSDPCNWTGVPQPDDWALITNDVASGSVIFDAAVDPMLERLDVDGPSAMRTLAIIDNLALSADYEDIGLLGQGRVQQHNGLHHVGTRMVLGGNGGMGTYNLIGGQLDVNTETIGAEGTGSFYQSGGQHHVSTLFMGSGSGSGSYQLDDGDLQVDNNEYVGLTGSGIVHQNVGDHTVGGNLIMAQNDTASANYNLYGGNLTVDGEWEIIGYSGTASFQQKASSFHEMTSPTGYFVLGLAPGSSGTYEMVDSCQMTVSGTEVIGDQGTGEFYQGPETTNSVGGNLIIGNQAGGVGKYYINGSPSTLDVAGDMIIGNDTGSSGLFSINGTYTTVTVHGHEYVGKAGNGTVDQYSGTHNIDNNLYVDSKPAAKGVYNLYDGTLFVGDDELIGNSAEAMGQVYQHGGTHYVTLNLRLGEVENSTGELYLSGGELTVGQTFDEIGAICVGNLGTGTVVQNCDDGYSKVHGGDSHTWLTLGAAPGSKGTYTLNDGLLDGTGNEVKIGDGGQGYFYQNGGVFDASVSAMYIGDDMTGYGYYGMTGGQLTAGALVLGEWGGTGTFVQDGGSVVVNDALILARQPQPILSRGTYTLNHGTLNVNSEIVGEQGIGIFNQTGGNHTVLGDLKVGNSNSETASGEFNLSGGELTAQNLHIGTNGRFNLSGGNLTIAHEVVNEGVFKTTGVMVTFTETFHNDGAYISDPSTQTFNNLEISQSGYLKGGDGDKFVIKGNMKNASLQNELWDTVNATLTFAADDAGGVEHLLTYSGNDFGADLIGYENNFAWGMVDITDNEISLQNGDDVWGGALYTKILRGVKFDLEDPSFVTNINVAETGMNLYYLANAPGNEYLGGLTYNLASNGHLIPIVPEPMTLVLLAVGSMALIRRRKA